MIHRLIELSARNRVLVCLLTCLACVAGWMCMRQVPVDAVPDLSETQVIITSRWDRSPDMVEDQVTFPIVNALTGAPRVKSVRGISDFGSSFVYVIFDEGTDLYWARSRMQEYLAPVLASLPSGVSTKLGPDATSLGWVFQYAVIDRSGRLNSAELRSLQDWTIRTQLRSVKGVSEVATVGGFSKQYQVNVDPQRLRAHNVTLPQVLDAVRGANAETGARLLESGGAEYMVRGVGYLQSVDDLQKTVVTASADGTPVTLAQLGRVELGPDLRRGAADLDGHGETVTGIVIMRDGENVSDVVARTRECLQQIAPGLPPGVEILPVYDRAALVHRSIHELRWTLVGVMITVALVIFLFLWHAPSALIPVLTIPAALLLCFIPFRLLGLSANIMSLCGLAIAVGALVDASIVVVEQTHKRLESWQEHGCFGDATAVIVRAVQEVARPSFFALLIIAVSFLPVLALPGEEGKLFRPLAYTKTLAILAGAILALTFDPALRVLLMRLQTRQGSDSRFSRWLNRLTAVAPGTEQRNPVTRVLIRGYRPVLTWALDHPRPILGIALVALVVTVPVACSLNSELMPPIEEGSLLYMPTLPPNVSIATATRFLQTSDRILKSFPEVDHVLGKAGRADTATDPAPLSMIESVITLKPEDQWPRTHTWYSGWAPEFLKPVLRHITRDHLSTDELVGQMNSRLQAPGIANGWTMPIQGRVTMLSTGVRTPLGVKVSAPDLATVASLSDQVARQLRSVPGARSVLAERPGEGLYVDVRWKRDALARYGISMQTAQDLLSSAVGGENITTVFAGRERYPVDVRYMRDFRSDVPALQHVLVPTSIPGREIPLMELADVVKTTGPNMIRDEDGQLTGYIYVDLPSSSVAPYLRAGKMTLSRLHLPAGASLRWTGQFEEMSRAQERLVKVVPATLLLIGFLLWLNTRSVARTALILLAVPFSAIGAFWLLWLLGYSTSVAVWVGLIALLGVDAETGTFMLLYLDIAFAERRSLNRLHSAEDLRAAVLDGAAHRIRPKTMTVSAMFLGLLPVMWSVGPGATVMKHIAAPMIGGLASSFCLELLIYPILYEWWHRRSVLVSESELIEEMEVTSV